MSFDIRTASPAQVIAEAERRAALRAKGLPLASVAPLGVDEAWREGNRKAGMVNTPAAFSPEPMPFPPTPTTVGVHDPYARMNKTERAYALYLDRQKAIGDVKQWWFEAIKFTLAPGTTYTPDFGIVDRSCELYFVEVKGFWRDDAKVKIKVAAGMFPFRFIAVQKIKSEFVRQDFTAAL